MRFIRRITQPEVFLRLGLGLTFLYSGYDIYKNPTDWTWYIEQLPSWLLSPVLTYTSLKYVLLFQGTADMLAGIVFIVWFAPRGLVKLVSFLTTIKLALILWLVGIDTVTFRDIGLLGASLAVFATMSRKR